MMYSDMEDRVDRSSTYSPSLSETTFSSEYSSCEDEDVAPPVTHPSSKPLIITSSELKSPWPAAVVAWCSLKETIVKCPYCGQMEAHPPLSEPARKLGDWEPEHLALAHCELELSMPYSIRMPGENHPQTLSLGWEFNQEHAEARIETVGLLKKGENNTDHDMIIPNTGRSIINFIQEFGHLAKTSRYQIPHDHEASDSLGVSALAFAAEAGDIERMKILLTNMAKPNCRNIDGKTALMLASLWGHAEAVVLLLMCGADRDLKDKDRRTAADLAGSGWLLEKERREQKPLSARAPDERIQRQLISVLLVKPKKFEPVFQVSQNAGIKLDFDTYHTYRPGGKNSGRLSLMVPLITIVAAPMKSVGILLRGDSFPIIVAASGWNGKVKGSYELLDNASATKDVVAICDILGFQLPGKARDWETKSWGQPGAASACHVELQLMVAFAQRHVSTFVGGRNATELKHLKALAPQVGPPTAKILLDNKPCENCRQFQQMFEKELRLKFEMISIGRRFNDDAKDDNTSVENAVKEKKSSSGKSRRSLNKGAAQNVTPPKTPGQPTNHKLTPQAVGTPSVRAKPVLSSLSNQRLPMSSSKPTRISNVLELKGRTSPEIDETDSDMDEFRPPVSKFSKRKHSSIAQRDSDDESTDMGRRPTRRRLVRRNLFKRAPTPASRSISIASDTTMPLVASEGTRQEVIDLTLVEDSEDELSLYRELSQFCSF